MQLVSVDAPNGAPIAGGQRNGDPMLPSSGRSKNSSSDVRLWTARVERLALMAFTYIVIPPSSAR
jgi:hypothetical protein